RTRMLRDELPLGAARTLWRASREGRRVAAPPQVLARAAGCAWDAGVRGAPTLRTRSADGAAPPALRRSILSRSCAPARRLGLVGRLRSRLAAGRLLLLAGVAARTGAVDQLDQGDRCRVAGPDAELHHTGVAARSGRVARAELREELPHHARTLHQRGGATAGVQRAFLSERDEAVTPAL